MIFIKNYFLYSFISITILVIISSIYLFLYYSKSTQEANAETPNTNYYFSNSDFFWPVPGYHRITSPFGKRISPTTGASSNHSGIDIGVPEGTNIYSVLSGKVIFTGFKGAGGFTISIESNNYTISYCHVSPSFIVNTGDLVSAGNLVGNVGPKYVDGFNSPYKDSSGRSTNGATTGPHLHLTIKKDGIAVNPLDYF